MRTLIRISWMQVLGLLAVLFLGFTAADAQTTIKSAGNPKNSAYFPTENGYINLGSGGLHLEIPIASIPQRGDLSLPATLIYDSTIWEVTNGVFGLQWTPTSAGGWSFQYERNYGANASIQTAACPGDSSRTVYTYTAIQWRDAKGTEHTFPLQTVDTDGCASSPSADNPNDQGFATDGSGYYAKLTGYTSLSVWDPKGTLVVTTPVPAAGASDAADVDRNGNKILYGLDGTVQSDSMQHTPILETVATTDGNGLPVVLYLDVPVAQSHTARYTLTYETISTSTAFGVPAANFVVGQTGNVAESQAGVRVIQTIGLPDGTSYNFGYDSYGLLNSMTTPHGGTVSYGYSNDSGAGTTTPARWASSHNGSDGATSFAYANTGAYSPTSETGGYSCNQVTNTVSGALLTQLYVFSSCGGSIQPMKILLSPTSNPSIVDKFTLFQYDFSHPCQKSACTGAQWIGLIGATTVLPSSGTRDTILNGTAGSGLISDAQTTYDTQGSGAVTAVKQWDYYSGTYPVTLPDSPPGNPKRETDISLGYSVNGVPYPTAVVTKDSSNTPVSEVQYTYDEAAYLSSTPSGAPNHDNSLAAATRGNPTTIRHIPHGTGSAPTLAYHFTYDDAGAVVATQDAGGYITAIGHDATDTFTQTVTRPQTAGVGGSLVSHVTTTVHDFNTGQVLSVTDENGQVHSRQYDSLGRLSSTQFSNGGSPVTLSTVTYQSANETDISTLQVQDAYQTASIPTSTVVDGYGRPIHMTQAGVTSDTTYDSQGRIYSVTNAHTSTAQPTDGTSYFTYDELGRLSAATLPSGHSTAYNYLLNTVTSTDPLSHSRQKTVDAFGNITSVLEPDASGSLTWQTVYVRNDLGALTEIDQQGGVADPLQWRSRYFSYDCLGRLSSQTTQEAGQYTYSYDGNGNVLSSTNQNTSANSVSYTYDALNRVVTKQVGGGPTYTYTYDAQDASGDPYGIGRLTSTSDGGTVQTRYRHDALGRVVSEANCRPSDCSFAYSTIASFDFAGNLRALTYPDGRKVEWVYDLFNRPARRSIASGTATR